MTHALIYHSDFVLSDCKSLRNIIVSAANNFGLNPEQDASPGTTVVISCDINSATRTVTCIGGTGTDDGLWDINGDGVGEEDNNIDLEVSSVCDNPFGT